MEDDSIDMGDDSIDTEDDNIDMGHLFTLLPSWDIMLSTCTALPSSISSCSLSAPVLGAGRANPDQPLSPSSSHDDPRWPPSSPGGRGQNEL